MGKISELPDELLVKILSSVPTKLAVSTSVLSKRWKFLWMSLPKLEYSDNQGKSLRDFINKNLPLHRAPVIERLCLELWESHDSKINPEEDIKLWLQTAVSRRVRDPGSFLLFRECMILKDVPSTGCRLPSEPSVYVSRVLEDLEVRFIEDEYPQMFTAAFPLLRAESVVESIPSVKRLTVCSEVEEEGFVLDELEHLELCVCKDDSLDLLAQFLKDAPNLRVLDISILDCHGDIKTDDKFAWYQPSCVPECMLPSLRVFNWSRYVGRPRDRDIAVYILRNAPNLRTATFMFDADVPNVEILTMELTLVPPASSTCELVFV
ncbi:putative FBD-associated F-box protein [Raphanus sativus]|nr:putative FBD-associated F-box protein [Raphanus sativus]